MIKQLSLELDLRIFDGFSFEGNMEMYSDMGYGPPVGIAIKVKQVGRTRFKAGDVVYFLKFGIRKGEVKQVMKNPNRYLIEFTEPNLAAQVIKPANEVMTKDQMEKFWINKIENL